MFLPATSAGRQRNRLSFRQYKRIKGNFENGVFTGKGLEYGGSLSDPSQRATALRTSPTKFQAPGDSRGDHCDFRRGNVAWGVAKAAAELGAKVVTISDLTGCVLDKDGICTEEKFEYMNRLRYGRCNAADHKQFELPSIRVRNLGRKG